VATSPVQLCVGGPLGCCGVRSTAGHLGQLPQLSLEQQVSSKAVTVHVMPRVSEGVMLAQLAGCSGAAAGACARGFTSLYVSCLPGWCHLLVRVSAAGRGPLTAMAAAQ